MQKGINYYKEKMLLCAHYIFTGMFLILAFEITISLYGEGSIFRDISPLLFVIYAFLLGSIMVRFCRTLSRIKIKGHDEKIYIVNETQKKIILWGIWLIIQIIYIGSTWSYTDSDAGVIGMAAYNLSQGEEMLEWLRDSYLPFYPNNVVYCMLLTGFHSLFGWAYSFEQSWLVTAILAGVFADLAIFWIVKLIGRVCGKQYYTLAFICACFLVGLSEEGSILYTDIITLWTIPCSIYYIHNICSNMGGLKNTLKSLVLAGGCLGFGFTMKPQVCILPIAFSIVYLLRHVQTNKKVIVNLSIFLLTFLIVNTSMDYCGRQWFYDQFPEEINAKQYIDEREFSALHFINMGLNEQTLGAYSEADVETSKITIGKKEKQKVWLTEISSRLSEKGLEVISFWNKKVLYSIQNGTFSQELIWKGKLLCQSDFVKRIAKYFVSVNKEWKNGLGALIQTGYMIMFVFVAFGALIRRKFKATILISEIALIGIVLFLLLFERNIRYFYTMLPCFILLFVESIEDLTSKSVNGKERLQ